MRIVVCVGLTTGAAVDATDAAIRAGSTSVSALRESDTHAVEQALRIAELRRTSEPAARTEIVVVTLAPSEALGAVREALALGADRAVLVDDASIRHLDLSSVAPVVAALLASEPAELYVACTWSGDIDGLLLWYAVGERLQMPVVSQASELRVDDDGVRTTRQSEHGDQVATAPLPCLVEITANINQARYPTIKGRASAQNKRVDLIRPDQLGIDVAQLARTTQVVSTQPSTRTRTPTVVDDARTAAEQIVAFLRERRFG